MMMYLLAFAVLLLLSAVANVNSAATRNRVRKKPCTTIEFASKNAIFQAFQDDTVFGSTAADVPLFDRSTGEKIGDFSAVSFDLVSRETGSDATRGFENGFIRIFDAQGTVAGVVYYAGRSPSGGDFAITGGTGVYACAEGVFRFVGFTNDQFELDLITCGATCSP